MVSLRLQSSMHTKNWLPFVFFPALAIATALLFRDWRREGTFAPAYKAYRRNLGRGILLGLEFLVIADIIGTVAIEPTFRNLGVLGLIVLIRSFLSFSLEVEIEGKLPWKQSAQEDGRRGEAHMV